MQLIFHTNVSQSGSHVWESFYIYVKKIQIVSCIAYELHFTMFAFSSRADVIHQLGIYDIIDYHYAKAAESSCKNIAVLCIDKFDHNLSQFIKF